MGPLHIGLLLPSREAQILGWDARRIIDVARRAESLGFDSVWAGDVLRPAQYEPLSVLAVAGAVTERVALGTAALVPAYRQPLGAAASLASLDALSGGRLVVGVGAGYPGLSEDEFALMRVPHQRRFQWLDDVVSLWRAVWSDQPPESFEGAMLRLDWLPEMPAPHRPGGPPVWFAGVGRSASVRAGRHYDGWLPFLTDPAVYVDGLAALHAAASGREVTPAMYLTVVIDDDEERGLATARKWSIPWYEAPPAMVEAIQASTQAYVIGSASDVAARLDRCAQAGARHLVVRMASLDPEGALDEVADAVLQKR